MADIGVYIHIPFCRSKCCYCDFNSFDNKKTLIPSYVEALKSEITGRSEELRKFKVASIFWGGGTPTLLPTKELQELFDCCIKTPGVAKNAEITIEANPGSITGGYLNRLYRMGFNRISIGAQSFNNNFLRILGRSHKAEDILSSVSQARSAGFNNLSLDIIFGIPGEKISEWRGELERMIDLCPDHISLYNLTVENGTKFYYAIKNGTLHLPSDEDQVEMYEMGIEVLKEAGYNHYEISNFSMKGKECAHNRIYWENREYAGFGAGAFSYIKNERRGNIESPEEYIHAVKSREDLVRFREHLSTEKRIRETMVLNLRLLKGVEIAGFRRRFGKDPCALFRSEIKSMQQEGLILGKKGRIALSRKGLLLSNNVFMEFV